ncbi:uncharacterized protein LOC119189652 [Manduca sexta]|uniref:uncharacterized protein LOC119189652 n=1 Tax=Manduca sexta TaxID=7130 RepID=UPI00189043A3|nr:uncharacterized protein LOC119189652 [Manduca sexta]
MDDSSVITPCDDGSCCCVSNRSTAVALIDMLASEDSCECDELMEYVNSIRQLLVTLFQMANTLLLLAAMVESAFLVQIYIWYVLGFVIMGLVVSLLGFLFKLRVEKLWTSINFVSEVAFLFVIFRCLPIVDLYRKRVEVK